MIPADPAYFLYFLPSVLNFQLPADLILETLPPFPYKDTTKCNDSYSIRHLQNNFLQCRSHHILPYTIHILDRHMHNTILFLQLRRLMPAFHTNLNLEYLSAVQDSMQVFRLHQNN